MSLATWCDLTWAEIWDDCPPMGDRVRYRDIMVRLIIDGDDPVNITWVDEKGKTHRLSNESRKPGQRPSQQQFSELASLQERIRIAQEKAKSAVASTDDG
jgi:hypothetical protein